MTRYWCAAFMAANNQQVYTYSGSWWFWTGKECSLYNHTQAPNGHVPDCIHGSCVTSIAMSTARSFHPGGVNLLFGDGSVTFVREGLDQAIWRSLGTRNGGELVDPGTAPGP